MSIKNILDDKVKIGRPTSDNELLKELVNELGMSKSEILRRGIEIQHKNLDK